MARKRSRVQIPPAPLFFASMLRLGVQVSISGKIYKAVDMVGKIFFEIYPEDKKRKREVK